MAAASNTVLSDTSLTTAQSIVLDTMLVMNTQAESATAAQIADTIEAAADKLDEAGWSGVERKKFIDRVRSVMKGLENKAMICQLQDGTWRVESWVLKPVAEAVEETVQEIAGVERPSVTEATRAPRTATVTGTGTWRDGMSGNKIAKYEKWGLGIAAQIVSNPDNSVSRLATGVSAEDLRDKVCLMWLVGGKGYNERKLWHELSEQAHKAE